MQIEFDDMYDFAFPLQHIRIMEMEEVPEMTAFSSCKVGTGRRFS